MYSTLTVASALLAAGTAYAQTTHEVTATPELTFDPDTLENVAEGDMIRVTFGTVPHNILSGSWDSACAYNAEGGVNSGVHQSGEVFVFPVNSTDSQIYFCSVGQHCQAGMALAVNPSGDNTVEAYATAAADAETVQPESEGPEGGMVEEEGEEEEDMMTTMEGDMTESSSTMMPTETNMSEMSATGTESMPSETGMMTESASMPSETMGGGAAGLRSGAAMVGAIVAGGVAFAV